MHQTNLLLIGKVTEVLAIRTPQNKVRKPWTQLRILLIARNLPPLELEAGVDAKCLVVQVPAMDWVRRGGLCSTSTYSESFTADCQLGGKLTEGMGHAGQRTASSPGDVPLIPAWS